jgi:hypothetical protein
MVKIKNNKRSLLASPLLRGMICLLFLLGGALFFSCNQDPIFYHISYEYPPEDPKIEGTPTNIVVFDDKIYVTNVGSGTIHSYHDNTWDADPMPRPPGAVQALAATDDYLYVLVWTDSNMNVSALYKWGGSGVWTQVSSDAASGYSRFQSIFGAGNFLFLSASPVYNNGGYALFYDNNGTLALLTLKNDNAPSSPTPFTNTAELKGAVYDGTAYYIATAGRGIFKSSAPGDPWEPVSGTANGNIMGIIRVGNKVAAVGRSGEFFYSNGSGGFSQSDSNVIFTGGLGIWKQNINPNANADLLLLGIRGGDTSTTHGYREIKLNNGELNTGSLGLRLPGQPESGDPTSVGDAGYAKYNASIGTHPVHSILQVPQAVNPNWEEDEEPVIFAGTSIDGLWSYRNNEWNAEP